MKYIPVIPLITSCCQAGLVGTELKTEEDLHHFALCLEFKSNVAYKLNQKDCASWIKEDTYKDSIYNVISNAIADCALKQNEFQEEEINNGVIKFKDTIPDNYTPENWNAVVLYNLIYFAFQYKQKGISIENSDGVINKFFDEYIVNRKVEQIYGGAYKENIERAFADIKQYSNELDLINYIINNEHFDEIYRTSLICEDYNKNGRAKITIKRSKLYGKASIHKMDGEFTCDDPAGIAIEIEKNKMSKIYLHDKNWGMHNVDIDQYMNITYKSISSCYLYNKHHMSGVIRFQKKVQQIEEEIKEEFENYNEECIRKVYLLPGETRSEEGIDAGWYMGSDWTWHLAWLTRDDLWIDNAYILPGNIQLAISGNYMLGQKKIKLDKGCIRDLTLHERGKIKKINISSEYAGRRCELIAPRDCEGLVTNSHSIREFDIELELYDEGLYEYDRPKSIMKQTNKMFINNKNLEYIAPMHSIQKIDRLKTFVDNPKLKTVEIIIHYWLYPEKKWVKWVQKD